MLRLLRLSLFPSLRLGLALRLVGVNIFYFGGVLGVGGAYAAPWAAAQTVIVLIGRRHFFSGYRAHGFAAARAAEFR